MMDVEALQSLMNSEPLPQGQIEEARLRMEQSASQYRNARNALALHLLPGDSADGELPGTRSIEIEAYAVEAAELIYR